MKEDFVLMTLLAMVIVEKWQKLPKLTEQNDFLTKQKEVRRFQDQMNQLTQLTLEVSNCGFRLDHKIQRSKECDNLPYDNKENGWTIFLFSCECNSCTSYMSMTLVCHAIVK